MHKKISLMSFGFKYGFPIANYYFDVGFIKNPAREPNWNFFSPHSQEIVDFVAKQSQVKEFINKVIPLILFLNNIDQKQVFAFGCSAGRHRSVVVVEEIARILQDNGLDVNIVHRDV